MVRGTRHFPIRYFYRYFQRKFISVEIVRLSSGFTRRKWAGSVPRAVICPPLLEWLLFSRDDRIQLFANALRIYFQFSTFFKSALSSYKHEQRFAVKKFGSIKNPSE